MLFKDIKNDLHSFKKSDQEEYSYRLYNDAINLIKLGNLTNAYKLTQKSIYIDENNISARNLCGLLSLIMCDFDKSFEHFYRSINKQMNEIAKKYVEYFLSDEFTCFLKEYNKLIRYVNLGEYEQAIEGFEDIEKEYHYLIEPKIILYYLFKDIYDIEEAKKYLIKIQALDCGNTNICDSEITYQKNLNQHLESTNDINYVAKEKNKSIESKNKDTTKKENKKNLNTSKKKVGIYILISLLLVALCYNFYEINVLKNEITQNTSNNQISEDKNIENQENKNGNADDKNEQDDKTSENSSEKIKEDKTNQNLTDKESFEKAIEFKNNKEYDNAINLYKGVIDNSLDKKYISESIYQVASLSEKLDKYSEAEKYYLKYIEKYNKEYPYYEESYYNLGLLYYKNGELEKSKDIFREFKKKVPDSEYNNSKVKDILSKQ